MIDITKLENKINILKLECYHALVFGDSDVKGVALQDTIKFLNALIPTKNIAKQQS